MDYLRELFVLPTLEGKFGCIFDQQGDKKTKSIVPATAAKICVLLKGPDTVIAFPSGNTAINVV